MTGDSPPEIVVQASPVDSLSLLEAQAEEANLVISLKEADLIMARSLPGRTAVERQSRIVEIREARAALALAQARAHRAKDAYLQMYASIYDDADARVSAYVHRRKAGECFQEAYALASRKRPTVAPRGRLGRLSH